MLVKMNHCYHQLYKNPSKFHYLLIIGLYYSRNRCLPDTEFHLDIPKHTWPPV